MLANEYFLEMLKTDNMFLLKWYYSVFTYNKGNEYVVIKDNSYYVKVNDELVIITDKSVKEPLLKILDKITLEPKTLLNQPDKIETTIGRVIINKLLLENCFQDLIPYINKPIKSANLEAYIPDKLRSKEISIEQYLMFTNTATFMEHLDRITTISITEKVLLPPEGLDKFKKELRESMFKKYGEGWIKDKARIVEYETALKEFDKEFIKDDPSYGKFMSGKVTNDARPKLFLTFGSEAGFDKKGLNPKLIDNSLLDGYPSDPEDIATLWNTARSGSFDRGNETQKGGSAAKDILRSTSSISIQPGDCGSTMFKKVLVNKDIASGLKGRYMNVRGKLEEITQPENLIGQIVELRSPLFCKKSGSELCEVCVGKVMAGYPNGVALITTDISGILLNLSMKSMHTSTSKSMVFDIKKYLS